MLIRINEQPIVVGERVEPAVLDRADLHRAGLLHRLLHADLGGQVRLEAENCAVECFEETFSLYPCVHGYLTPDRQWRTGAEIGLSDGRVVSALFKVIQGRYAATEFVDRFRTSCCAVLGDPDREDRYSAHWSDSMVEITSALEPGAMNASFLLAVKTPAE